jgi:hypothetical protein
MNDTPDRDIQAFNRTLQEMATAIRELARQQQGDSQSLLLLLRTLERLHREIREQLFEPSLPNTRKELYNLLRDMEESGGWPYIERMRLKALLTHFLAESIAPPEAQEQTTD